MYINWEQPHKKKKRKQNAMWYSTIYSVLPFVFLGEKATIHFLWVPMYENAQGGKGLEKELELEDVTKKGLTFIWW